MTDMTLPPEAVEAAAKAMSGTAPVWDSQDDDTKDGIRALARLALEAALPHLRPLVEAQELRIATEVALKLGRQEAAEEINCVPVGTKERAAEVLGPYMKCSPQLVTETAGRAVDALVAAGVVKVTR
jgi:hypothetical protein